MEWIAEYNKDHPNNMVSYYGYDIQVGDHSIAKVIEFSRVHFPEKYERLEIALSCAQRLNWRKFIEMLPGEFSACIEEMRLALDDFGMALDMENDEIPTNQVDEIREELIFLSSYSEILLGLVGQGSGSFREMETSRITSEIIMNAASEDKFIVWAHNAHVSYRTGMFGKRLSEHIGVEQVLNLAFAFSDGSYTAFDMSPRRELFPAEVSGQIHSNYYEYYFALPGHNAFFLDLRLTDEGQSGSEWLQESSYLQIGGAGNDSRAAGRISALINLTDWFDTLIYIQESTPSRVMPEYFEYWSE